MAYYTGTANDMAALRQVLIDACVLEGWSWDAGAEVLSKGGLYLRATLSADGLSLLGRTSAAAGSAPNAVRIGKLFQKVGQPTYDIEFPATYEIFAHPGEVYLVVNYAADRYQWAAFGQSTVDGMSGTGMWFAATSAQLVAGSPGGTQTAPIDIGLTGTGAGSILTSAAPFWARSSNYATVNNGFVHSDLDGQGWQMGAGANLNDFGIAPAATLLGILPNSWNSEAVLLPIRVYKARSANKISLVADLEHARYTRVDNYEPGQVIAIGDDRWKVFPFYRKNAAVRSGGAGINHTGTFGWAIRYEGP
ncbi:hypothetical protein [Pseudomonas sp. AN-1]|uniref:hypothetical protein n=1 Tax=Pseudomonas sp. AN-1 TaxID=3096605 RepID=UPI002A6B035E|nr:hypothetical protein [Pseudomonas sp. AN-1]WPP47086.1 hypothetical protein SK095_06765 [Pseudomonas sp. AN-1]